MGLIGRMLGATRVVGQVGEAVGGMAEVFVGNRAEREAAANEAFIETVGQFGAEFQHAPNGAFDRFVDGLNRLPRPTLALSTLGLFVYAMAEPAGFSVRMEGLALVPEPLWWLLGAVVSFYFGARELHHIRTRQSTSVTRAERISTAPEPIAAPAHAPSRAQATRALNRPDAVARAADPTWNAAVDEWNGLRS
jgi:Holin of 3TMs, for gene-transfer release